MKFFRLSIFYLCLTIFNNDCLSAPEPLCSKFSYDEQLLEKMIRMEFNVNNMENSMLERQKNMEETLNVLDVKLKQLKEKGRLDDRVIAFHAHEAADKSLANNQVIVFTKVIMNEGDCYDKTNGYFTASVAGLYHFTSHLCALADKNVEYVFYVSDAKWASGLYRAKTTGTCTSFSVTVRMQRGERAWVTIDAYGSSTTDVLFEDSDDWNYFSGFLITRMD